MSSKVHTVSFHEFPLIQHCKIEKKIDSRIYSGFPTNAISNQVENTLKCSLNLIPPPSVKIQIMDGKVCLKCKGTTLLVAVNKTKSFTYFKVGKK